MPRPQWSLLAIFLLVTLSCALASWLRTATRSFPPRTTSVVVGLNPPAQGLPFPDFTTGLDIPFNQSPALFWKDPPDRFMHLAIVAAMLLVATSWLAELFAADRPRLKALARLAWTLGFLLYLTHVACAFTFVHEWSHAQAAWHTGYRTWQMTGWFWTGGIWVNY